MKSRVYIETSIISYLTARPSNDLRVVANQNITIDWWETMAPRFDLYISEFVVVESGLGDPDAAKRRLALIDGIPELEVTDQARELGQALITEGPIPSGAEVDAYHIAVVAANGIEYLLTWNCTHIANATIRPLIETTCRRHGFEPPIICTPQELMEE